MCSCWGLKTTLLKSHWGGKAGKRMNTHSVAKLQVPLRDSVGVSLNSLDHQDVCHISTYISRNWAVGWSQHTTKLFGAWWPGKTTLLCAALSNTEGSQRRADLPLQPLEPALVSSLTLEEVQLSVAHHQGEELVPATLVPISCTCQDLVGVKSLRKCGKEREKTLRAGHQTKTPKTVFLPQAKNIKAFSHKSIKLGSTKKSLGFFGILGSPSFPLGKTFLSLSKHSR